MAYGIQGISQWNTWRVVTVEDSDGLGAGTIDEYKPSEVWDSNNRTFNSTHASKFISVHPYTSIALAFYGLGSEDDTALITIAGWMFPDSKTGPGPGTELWKGTVAAGSVEWSNPGEDIPLRDGYWTSQEWRPIDDFTATFDVTVGQTLLMEDASAATGVMLVTTLGFSHLSLVIDNLDGLNELTQVGAIWRGISKEGVL